MKLDPSLPRKIEEVTLADIKVDEAQYNTLVAIAHKHLGEAWDHSSIDSPLTESEKILVQDFKTTLKKFLYKCRAARYCCFCGCELQMHDATKDLEHIVSKNGKKNVVFSLRNIALSCKDCNSPKGQKKVTIDSVDENTLDDMLLSSEEYLIVHPYLDEWQQHFLIDEFKRVLARDVRVDSKASRTLRICRIHKKNAMRLADYFTWFGESESRSDDWVDFYSLMHGEEDALRIAQLAEFARDLADVLRNPADPGTGTIEFALGELLMLSGLYDDYRDLSSALPPSLMDSATKSTPGETTLLALPPPEVTG